jgi:hypothetical protein
MGRLAHGFFPFNSSSRSLWLATGFTSLFLGTISMFVFRALAS